MTRENDLKKYVYGREGKLKDSYTAKIRRLEQELSGPPPRVSRLRPGAYLQLFLYFLFLDLILFFVPYLVFSLVLRKSFPAPVFLLLATIISMFFIGVVSALDRKKVREWEKVVGEIESVLLVGGDVVTPMNASFMVHYQYRKKEWSARTSLGWDIRDAGKGDPIVLLVDPENPKSCVEYGGLAWKAVGSHESD